MSAENPSKVRRVGFLLTPGYPLLSAAAAVEPLRAANLLSGQTLFQIQFLSADGGFLRSSAHGGFETVALFEPLGTLDLLFVVSGGDPFAFDDRRVLNRLNQIARQGTILGGISGGSVILAAAGLMSNRRFTVHWMHIGQMRELYPDAMLERRLFVIDRDRYTCAGGMAPLDMMHAIIAKQHGSELARSVSDWFIHTGIRDAEAPQQLDPAIAYELSSPALVAMVGLMSTHIADPLNASDLAKLSGLSVRQLERLAKNRFGLSVMQFYRDLRLEKADELLRHSSLSIDAIAQMTGFLDRSHLSRFYTRKFGNGPATRRRQQRSPALPGGNGSAGQEPGP